MSGFIPDPDWPSMEELATELWGHPTDRRRSEIRFGTNGAKVIDTKAFTWFDFEANEGGGYIELHKLARGELPPRKEAPKRRPNGKHNGPAPWDDIATLYPYHDADGDVILEVIRTLSGKPRFRQRCLTGDGKWRWSVKHVPNHDCLLYRLPGLRHSGDEIVWVTEGEKDCDRLHGEGLIATTNIGGAGKWRDEYNEEFRGKPCVVLVDNDNAGRWRRFRRASGRPAVPGREQSGRAWVSLRCAEAEGGICWWQP
jgi:hypothetical protein